MKSEEKKEKEEEDDNDSIQQGLSDFKQYFGDNVEIFSVDRKT